MILSLSTIAGRGEEADVFLLPGAKRVLKVYRYAGSPPESVWRYFLRESAGYTRVANMPTLARSLPARFVPPPIDRIVDTDGVSVTDRYFVPASLCLEFVPGTPCKFLRLPLSAQQSLQVIIDRFESLGISALDASVFDWADTGSARFIDVHTRELWNGEDRPCPHRLE